MKVGWSGGKKSEWDEAARAERDDWGREVSGGGGWRKEREDWRRKEKRRHEETMQGEGGGKPGTLPLPWVGGSCDGGDGGRGRNAEALPPVGTGVGGIRVRGFQAPLAPPPTY